jgi:hypothetical protein
MFLKPELITNCLKGVTYNFSVHSALPEDFVGILKFLEKINKIPRNIITGFDFFILNENLPTDYRFLNVNELNFFNKKSSNNTYLSFDLLKLSIKNLTMSFKGELKEPNSYFDKYGLEHQKYNETFSDNFNDYFTSKYSSGEYKISKKRIKYLKYVKNFAEQHNIKIYSFMTPMHYKFLNKLNKNKNLNYNLEKFKENINQLFSPIDLMQINKISLYSQNFNDSTHVKPFVADNIIDILCNDVLSKNIAETPHLKTNSRN